MKTRAAVLCGINGPLELMEVEVPELQRGQVLVRILYSGICHSQLNEIDGLKGEDRFLPHTLGHEASGIVEKAGPGVAKVKPSDYVALSWIKGRGLDNPAAVYNAGGQKINSGAISTFLEHAVVSENRLTAISRDIPPQVASLLGCTVQTAAGIIKNNINPKPGSSLAIFGAGGIGLAALLFARCYECSQVIVVDINESKLELARKLGVTHTVNAANENVVQKIMELTGGGVDYAIECSGAKQAMDQAFSSINNSGLAVIAGNLSSGERISIDPFDLIKGKRIMGSWGGQAFPDEDLPFYVGLYKEGKFKIDKLISKIFSFEDVNSAIDEFRKGDVVRVLLRMDGQNG